MLTTHTQLKYWRRDLDRPRRLWMFTSKHLNLLPRNNIVDLRTFYGSIESHIRGLSSMVITPKTYGTLLIPVTLGKNYLQMWDVIWQNKSDWNIEELREALLREIRLLGQGVFTPATCLSDPSQMMTATLYTGTRSGHSRQCRSDRGAFNKKPTCVYYKSTHTTNNCDVIVSTEKRLEHFKRRTMSQFFG